MDDEASRDQAEQPTTLTHRATTKKIHSNLRARAAGWTGLYCTWEEFAVRYLGMALEMKAKGHHMNSTGWR